MVIYVHHRRTRRQNSFSCSLFHVSAVRDVLYYEDVYRLLRMGPANKLVGGLCVWDPRGTQARSLDELQKNLKGAWVIS
jgi:hypothetical protein